MDASGSSSTSTSSTLPPSSVAAPKQDDWLTTDPPIDGQKFAVLTAVGPHCTQKAEVFAIKIRGTYEKIEDAKKRASELSSFDNHQFDIFVVEVGGWIKLPPPTVAEIEDVTYPDSNNEVLNSILRGQVENRKMAQALFEERRQLVKEGIIPPEEELTAERLHELTAQRKAERAAKEAEEKAKEEEEEAAEEDERKVRKTSA